MLSGAGQDIVRESQNFLEKPISPVQSFCHLQNVNDMHNSPQHDYYGVASERANAFGYAGRQRYMSPQTKRVSSHDRSSSGEKNFDRQKWNDSLNFVRNHVLDP